MNLLQSNLVPRPWERGCLQGCRILSAPKWIMRVLMESQCILNICPTSHESYLRQLNFRSFHEPLHFIHCGDCKRLLLIGCLSLHITIILSQQTTQFYSTDEMATIIYILFYTFSSLTIETRKVLNLREQKSNYALTRVFQ